MDPVLIVVGVALVLAGMGAGHRLTVHRTAGRLARALFVLAHDVDLPEPEAVPVLVPESLLGEDVYALPFSVAAVVTLAVALVMMGG